MRFLLRHSVLLLLALLAGAAARAQPVCAVEGPDSVFFDKTAWNRYLPPSFVVRVTVTNPGTAAVDSLVAFARSNTRFTAAPPAAVLLTLSLPPGDTARAEFTMIVNPRDVSGMDTVAVILSGKAGNRAECLLPVWVEKEYRPVNVLLCPPDSTLRLTFIDTLNAYAPDPFAVLLRVENRGDAPSKDTRLFIVATPGVSPADGQAPVLDLGTLDPGSAVDTVVRLRAVRRSNDTVVALPFRVQGRGGLGDRLGDTLCALDLRIPAARDALLALDCRNGITIAFRDGRYDPESFTWTARLRNTGDAVAAGVRVFLVPPPALRLDSLTPAETFLGTMTPGRDTAVSWLLHVRGGDRPDTAVLCVYASDRLDRRASCCDTVLIPPRRSAALYAACTADPDSIGIDPGSGVFLPSSFDVRVQVQNRGSDPADSVRAELVITDNDIRLLGPPAVQLLAARLDPNHSAACSWQLAPLPNPTGRAVPLLVRVTGLRAAEAGAACAVYVTGTLAPALACTVTVSPDDTLHPDLVLLRYPPLSLRATVRNTGRIDAANLEAAVLLPPGIGLAGNARNVVPYPAGALAPDSVWTVDWPLEPLARRDGTLDTIGVEFRAGGLRTVCADWIFIVGIPPITVLTIPANNVERYGRPMRIPVRIDNTEGKTISRLDLAIAYDAGTLRFDGFDRRGAMLDSTWMVTDLSAPGLLRFQAEADTAVLHGQGDLLFMNFTVLFGSGADQMRWSGTELDFDSTASTVNRGAVLARFFNGYAYVSGDCLWPLDATEAFVYLQTRPNPVRGEGTISYRLTEDGPVRLVLYGETGVPVRVLVDAVQQAGEHQARFDASGLPAGAYHCLLQSSTAARMLRVLVLR
jgi:hypothetical protein